MDTQRKRLLAAGPMIAACLTLMPASGVVSAAPDESSGTIDRVARYPTREVTIPAGTTLSLQLDSTVSSRSSRIEQPVHATLRHALVVHGITVVPAGSPVSGYVNQVQRSGRVKGRARIGVRFTSLRVADTRYSIQTASIARQ